jgi:histone deacetylase 8
LSSLEAPQGHKLLQFLRPVRASFKDLSVYHSRDYLEHVLDTNWSYGSLGGSAIVTAEFGLEDVSLGGNILKFNTHAALV